MTRFAAFRALLAAGGLTVVGLPTQAQTGAAALKKVADAYTALNTYEATSALDSRLVTQGKPLQSVSNTVYLKFKQPNKINLQVRTASGSISVISNGVEMFIYDARSNAYLKAAAPADGKKLVQEMTKQAGISAFLDPLFFLTKLPMPATVGSLAVKGSETYSGHPVTVITGAEKMQGGVTRNWKWWIDRDTNLIRKVESLTTPRNMKLVGMNGKKKIERTIAVSQMTRNIVADSKPNANLGDDIFKFTIPPNAVVKKSVQELLQGK